jgi:predicted nucleic acid-binding protein
MRFPKWRWRTISVANLSPARDGYHGTQSLISELRRALRRIKPHGFTQPLRRRRSTALPFVTTPVVLGKELLLDTCVYIDVLQGRTPVAVDALLHVRTLSHLSVCVAELAHAFGRLDTRHPDTETTLDELTRTVAGIAPHRLAAARAEIVITAGILAGLLFRLGGLQSGQEVATMNDATLYLHALANGQIVLTRNVRDFDLMNQILPDGQVLFYERVD